MEDEPEIVFEADADAFSQAAELDDFFARGVGERRICGAKEKRADDAHGFEGLTEDAGFEGFDVNGDVREFGHAVSPLVSQVGAESIVQRRDVFGTGAAGRKKSTARSGRVPGRGGPTRLVA